MQADWQKTFEFDVMIGHYYPVMLDHYITTQLRIRNTDWYFEHVEQPFRKVTSGFVCNGFMLGYL